MRHKDIKCMCVHTRVCVLLSSSHTLLLSLPPLQSHQPPWLRFGTLDHIVFIWKYFSCIRATQRGKWKKGREGEKHTLLCESWRRPWTLPFIPFTSSAESNCQRGQETPGPIVPYPLWSLLRHEKWKACFWSFFLSYSHSLSISLSWFAFSFLSSSAILSFWVTPSFHTMCPLLHPRKIIIKRRFIK